MTDLAERLEDTILCEAREPKLELVPAPPVLSKVVAEPTADEADYAPMYYI